MTATPLPHQTAAGATPGRTVQRLLRALRDRTLYARETPDGMRLVKVYEIGTLDDARAEFRAAQLAQVEGTLVYHDSIVDPWSGRPCVVTDLHDGVDVESWLLEHGAIAPRPAARILLQLAHTVARLHAVQSDAAPHGVVHRDLKPANLLLLGREPDPRTAPVLLLDLEHVLPVGASDAAARGGFTGGTRELAPPEAFAGAVADPKIDVHGLGMVLHAMLTGTPPGAVPTPGAQPGLGIAGRWRRRLRGHPPELVRLVLTCTAEQPADRPQIRDVIDALTAFLGERDPAQELLDDARNCLAAARLDACDALLAGAPRSPRAEVIAGLLVRARWLLQAVRPPAPLPRDGAPLEQAQALLEATPRLALLASRFPAAPELLLARRAHLAEICRLLVLLPPTVHELMLAGSFDVADGLLRACQSALETTERRIGPVRLQPRDESPTLIERDPRRYLRAALDELHANAAVVEQTQARVQQAEAELLPELGERAVHELARQLGGTGELVTAMRDRLHRLRFYLERIARLRSRLQGLTEQLATYEIALDLTPIRSLLEHAATTARSDFDEPARASGGIQPLLRLLHDLAREFPPTSTILGEPLRLLDEAAASLTRQAWQQLAEAGTRLGSVPVPIRPLQGIVNRIDGLRLLEVLVDLPGQPREALLEELERVRLRVDEARALRDRLARGAQEAIELGHLTTAMYEIERAVDRFATDGDDAQRTAQLVEQLELARRQKRAIEQAAGRNQTLAAQYAELLDDPDSSRDQRIELLEQRLLVLDLLVRSSPEERARPYRLDRREVQVALLQERSAAAELQLAATNDPAERVRIARLMLPDLQEKLEEGAEPGLSLGRVARLAELWRARLQQSEGWLRERVSAERAASRARLRRRVSVAAGAILLTFVTWTTVEAAMRPPELPERIASVIGGLSPRATAEQQTQSLARCVALLETDEQRPAATADAHELVRLIRELLDPGARRDVVAIGGEFDAAMLRFQAAAEQATGATAPETDRLRFELRRFAQQARLAALLAAAPRSRSDAERAWIRDQARAQLPAADAARVLAELR
jgi:hypothetical protein